MEPKLLFWTYAQGVLTLCVLSAVYGIRQITLGQVEKHRKAMNLSGFLILFFVLSYAGKLFFLGRELLDTWETLYVVVLRIHEVFILGMLVTGGWARYLAYRWQVSNTTKQMFQKVALHKQLGKAAQLCAIASWLTAGFVLYGMYQRL